MKKIKIYLFLSLSVSLFLASCKKEEKGKGSLQLNFENRVGENALQLDAQTYSNALGESFTVSRFDYYVSNIALRDADGNTYTVPQEKSYFLLKQENEASRSILLNDIPEADYVGLSFVLGVDSVRSTRPIAERPGVLDPSAGAQGMYWTWNSGYIFVKLEGISPQAPLSQTSGTHPFYYHIGGFGGYDASTVNNIKHIELDFGGTAAVVIKDKPVPPAVNIRADLRKMLDGPTQISFATHAVVMSGAYSVNIANNYRSMFSVANVSNN